MEILRYYDEFAKTNERVKMAKTSTSDRPLTVAGQKATASDKLYVVYNEVKAKLRKEFAEYPSLRWELFEAADLYIYHKLWGIEPAGFPLDGYWNNHDGQIYFNHSLVEEADQVQRRTIARELIYALTKPKEATTILYNGFVEYVAQTLYPTDIDYCNYLFPQQFAALYAEANGIQAAFDLFLTDAAADQIGKAINRPNAIYTIEPPLRDTCYGIISNLGTAAILDILAHYSCKLQANPDIVGRLLNKMHDDPLRYTYDEEYIRSVLRSVFHDKNFHG